MQTKELLENTVKILDNKKAEDIKALEITDLSSVADYFVIVSGTSSTHIGKEPNHVEGRSTGWILLDYGTVIVHIFTPADRENFNLEKLWQDAKEVDVSKWIIE